MKIKTKVTFGVFFLFSLILTLGGLGIYYLNMLSTHSQNILVANYESLEFTKHIIEDCDKLKTDSISALSSIEKNLEKQELNVTESGEQVLTRALRSEFEKLKTNGIVDTTIVNLRKLALSIQDLNMKAIVLKSSITQKISGKASTYLVIIGTICVLAAFTFILNFPAYIADPIVQLTNSIKLIANKNYEERLHFDRKDEFEELAEAFNQMAEKLDEYEHSNLAKILFEKKRIETIINRMSDPVIGLDENNKVVFVNDQALNLLNLTSKEMMDRYAPDIAVNNDLFRNLIRNKNQNEDGSSLVKAVINSKENFFSKEAIPINYNPTGEKESIHIGHVILLKNITTFKELDQAKTNFIATISHELKTPIASLQMGVKLLIDKRVGSLNEEQQKIVNTLSDELVRLSGITNELLDLSQVESGNIKLNIRKSRPDDIIQLAVEAVSLQAKSKNVEIEIHIEKDLPDIQADIDKTTWVLVNYLTNAIRYSPENDRVVLTCELKENKVIFSVEDHGPGIERQFLKRIFEKFFQVPGTPTGTGLGLAISREFIEAQGGKLNVKSEVGKGSIFEFMMSAY